MTFSPQIRIDGHFAEFLDSFDDRLFVSSVCLHRVNFAFQRISNEKKFGEEIHRDAAQLPQMAQSQVLRNAQMGLFKRNRSPGEGGLNYFVAVWG